MPNHTARMPCPIAAPTRDSRPGPLRRRTAVEPLRDDLLRRVWLPDDRGFLLRDRGGEDVRVAMVVRLRGHPNSPTCHTPDSSAADDQRRQASRTTGMIMGRRRWLPDTQRPMVRRITCCS